MDDAKVVAPHAHVAEDGQPKSTPLDPNARLHALKRTKLGMIDVSWIFNLCLVGQDSIEVPFAFFLFHPRGGNLFGLPRVLCVSQLEMEVEESQTKWEYLQRKLAREPMDSENVGSPHRKPTHTDIKGKGRALD